MPAELFALPFIGLFMMLAFAIWALLIAFWIWMIVDVAQRKFKDDSEKIVWILVVILASWIGALVYYLVVKNSNPKGISKKK